MAFCSFGSARPGDLMLSSRSRPSESSCKETQARRSSCNGTAPWFCLDGSL